MSELAKPLSVILSHRYIASYLPTDVIVFSENNKYCLLLAAKSKVTENIPNRVPSFLGRTIVNKL